MSAVRRLKRDLKHRRVFPDAAYAPRKPRLNSRRKRALRWAQARAIANLFPG